MSTPTAGAAGSGAVATTPPVAANDALWCGVKKTLDANCTACHNEQKTAGAPMSLKTYADTQAPAVSNPAMKVYQLMGARVHDTARPMPPQQKLTTDQLTGIDSWVAASAPTAADPTCAATTTEGGPGTTADNWVWPTNCDATYKLLVHGDGGADQPATVAGGMESHPQFSVPSPWGSEEVQMIAWRAVTDNAKVLHHWILYGPSREHIVGWAPGKEHSADMPADVGLHLPSGNLTLDVHYNNLLSSTTEQDHSGLEVCLMKKANFRPKTAATYTGFSTFAISIPAHATKFDVNASCTSSGTAPVTLLTASPHAHKLATHMKFSVTRASGETVMMHDAPFNFDEQTAYPLDTPVVLGSGDKVNTTCTYDNPGSSTVTFGENTGNEMCFNFAIYYPMDALNCAGGVAGIPIPGF